MRKANDMKVDELIKKENKNEKYLTDENCRVFNSYMLDIVRYERPIFGPLYSSAAIYYGLLEDNDIFKFYISHRYDIINYKEFSDLKEALRYLFMSCKRIDGETNYDEAYDYIVSYLQISENKSLKLNK